MIFKSVDKKSTGFFFFCFFVILDLRINNADDPQKKYEKRRGRIRLMSV